MTSLRRLVVPLLLSVTASGCSQPHQLDQADQLGDAIPLAAPDSAPIGKPVSFTVGSDGSFFVGDGFFKRVIRFSHDGRLTGVFGEPGAPIELPSAIVSVGDSAVAIVDAVRSTIALFDVRSGSRIRERSFPVDIEVHRGLYDDGVLWFGALGEGTHEPRTMLLRWNLTTDSTELLGSLPPAYSRTLLPRWFPGIAVARAGATFMVGLAAYSQLLVLGPVDGRTEDSIAVPRRTRRGSDAREGQQLGRFGRLVEAVNSLSLLAQVGLTQAGSLLFVHYDLVASSDSTIDAATVFLTAISPDGATGCVDATAPLSGARHPDFFTALRGDTVFVAEDIPAADDRPHLVVRSYHLDPSHCPGHSATSLAGLRGQR